MNGVGPHEDRTLRERGAHFRLTPSEPSMAAAAFALFCQAYAGARRAQPLLPPLAGDHETYLQRCVERAFMGTGVVAWQGDAIAGFMTAGSPFVVRGLPAVLVPEYGHAVVRGAAPVLYGLLHAALAERWVREGVQLHLIGNFAVDGDTTAALHELGFGAIVAECLRDVSAPVTDPRVEPTGVHVEAIGPEEPWDDLIPLASEHATYYRRSPIFLVKDEDVHAVAADLEEHRRAGDHLFVHRSGGAPLAYLIVGRCRGGSEGRLLAGTNTAQVRSAYAVPALRRRGIGTVLLHHAVTWAREAGFERLFVEHETANLEGSSFWQRHFSRFLVFSMRYVART